ncbi:MAG: hypothetical protein GWP41_09940 [Planctomycetia bacterium]|jgi:hypothetical protein|nr:hypothetical protein [Planctomycetia bacterium]NCF98075.1 hypothetical protein [Planctomycetia bacterium]NCG13825.1 hypothetical protein [Planctomycetia bacterium]NCG56427.1 hypothetical protein [Pseudomonadota bacterium]
MSSENNTSEGDSKIVVRLSFGIFALLLIDMGNSGIQKFNSVEPWFVFFVNVMMIILGFVVLLRSLSMKS